MVSAASLAYLATFGTSTANAELLRIKPILGHRLEFQFKSHVHMKFGGEEGDLDTLLTVGERVLRVEPTRVTFQRIVEAERYEGHGAPAERGLDNGKRTTLGQSILVTDNRFQSILSPDHEINPVADSIDVVLPERPVTPGDTWEALAGPTRSQRIRYTLRGVANVGKRRVALIDLAETEPYPTGQGLESDSLFVLDLADGRWLRARFGFATWEKSSGEKVNGFSYRTTITRMGAPSWPEILAAFPPTAVHSQGEGT